MKTIGHILRHEEELHHRILQIEGKRGGGRPIITIINIVIKYAGLKNYRELKRLADNREEWRAYGKCYKINLKVDY